MADQNITLTLSGADRVSVLLRELNDRIVLVASIEEVERRIGRALDEELFRELFAIAQHGTDWWIEATPEFNRVMAALNG